MLSNVVRYGADCGSWTMLSGYSPRQRAQTMTAGHHTVRHPHLQFEHLDFEYIAGACSGHGYGPRDDVRPILNQVVRKRGTRDGTGVVENVVARDSVVAEVRVGVPTLILHDPLMGHRVDGQHTAGRHREDRSGGPVGQVAPHHRLR